MAFNAPLTAVANAALTAAQWNTFVRDNLNATAVALATAAGQTIVTTGLTTLAARTPQSAFNNASDLSTSVGAYSPTTTGTAGPSVTATSGTTALVLISGLIQPGATGSEGFMSYAVSGATTIAPNDDHAIRYTSYNASSALRAGIFDWPVLTAGANTFQLQFKVSTGTMALDDRRILVVPYS